MLRPVRNESTLAAFTSKFSVDCNTTTGICTGVKVSTLLTAAPPPPGPPAAGAPVPKTVATTLRSGRSGASPPRRSRCCNAPRATLVRPSLVTGLDTAVRMLRARFGLTRIR